MNNTIRQQLRQQRQALTNMQQMQAAQAIVKIWQAASIGINAQHIAFYLADDGELDPRLLMQALQDKSCYLPILDDQQLRFAAVDNDTPMHSNRFGILEPRVPAQQTCTANQLDLIFIPTVAFDRHGHRLGRGGGFYDKSLANIDRTQCQLIGIAHSFQEVAKLEPQAWDVILDAILTEKELILKDSACNTG